MCWIQFPCSHFAYYSSSEFVNLFRSASPFLTVKKHKNKETVKSRYMFCLFFCELLFKDLLNNFSFPTHSIESQIHLIHRFSSHDPLLIIADWTEKVNGILHSLILAKQSLVVRATMLTVSNKILPHIHLSWVGSLLLKGKMKQGIRKE